VCLEEDISVVQIACNIEQFVDDLLCAGQVLPTKMKRPQSRERWRQVQSFRVAGDLSGALEDSAYLHCSPAMDAHKCGTELGQDGELATWAFDIRRLVFVKG
jgi:hypothetical protein